MAERRRRASPPSLVLGVDTGGTFTDFVVWRRGRIETFKLLSTPAAPERAVRSGLRRAGVGRGDLVRHGFTVGTNALLERKGARVALVTTAGFEDLLEIGRQDRPRIYDLAPHRLPPLVPRHLRLGVRERLGPRGERWVPLTASELRRLTRRMRALRPRAVAVALLHAYADPVHERRVVRALARAGIAATASSALCPEVREYERMATTVTDAYLTPRVGGYLERVARATPARLEIMLSHGGTAPPRDARAVRTLLSGPAAGAVAALERARGAGFERALSIDVGGTSTDVAFLPGRLERRRDRVVGGFPVRLPMIDVHTIGAGGGSIARLDAGGLLVVGPESAGADPGPACYGHGGPATVTDALLVLGRIVPDLFAGGQYRIDAEAASRAVRALGARMGRDARGAAWGILQVANAHMERALRTISVERGEDPRGAALVAFGGAGGLHACELADALGLACVLAPRHAGLLSACGLVSAESRHERSLSVLVPAREARTLEARWRSLEREVRTAFGADARRARLERWAELRYAGQSHELTVRWGSDLEERFHQAHERRYGHAQRQREVEVVTIEARGSLPSGRVLRTLPPPRAGKVNPWGTTRAWIAPRSRAVPVLRRETLPAGWRQHGPALVVEYGSSVWIAPRWTGRIEPDGMLRLERGRGR